MNGMAYRSETLREKCNCMFSRFRKVGLFFIFVYKRVVRYSVYT